MSLIRVTLIKDGHNNSVLEVDKIVRELQADAEKGGFIPEQADITINTSTSEYHIEVCAERRGKIDSKYNSLHFWDAQKRQKSSCLELPNTHDNFQL